MNYPCGKLWKRIEKKRKKVKRDTDLEYELDQDPRIINGTLTKQGDSPWQVRGQTVFRDLSWHEGSVERAGAGKDRNGHAQGKACVLELLLLW